MIRVLYVLPCRFWGGPERQTLQAARFLREAHGCEAVFAVMPPRGTSHEVNPLLVRARAEGFVAEPFRMRHGYDPVEGVRTMHSLIRVHRPDVVSVAGYKANVLAALTRAVPTVAAVRGWTGEDWKVRAFEWLDQRTLRLHDAVVIVSESQRSRVVRAGVRADRVFLVRNGVDLQRLPAPISAHALRAELRLPREATLVGAVGRLGVEKGQSVLIDAFARLAGARPQLHLVLIGDGPEKLALATAAAARGVQDRVHLLGLRTDGAQLIGALDLLALPSYTEGLPNVVLEAFAYGTPVVASAVGGVPELVTAGETGWTVAPGQPEALAAALSEALDNPAEARRRAGMAHVRVSAEFSAEEQARAWLAAYRSVLRPS